MAVCAPGMAIDLLMPDIGQLSRRGFRAAEPRRARNLHASTSLTGSGSNASVLR